MTSYADKNVQHDSTTPGEVNFDLRYFLKWLQRIREPIKTLVIMRPRQVLNLL